MALLSGRYEFEPSNIAGKGGFGRVYKARDIRFDHFVALKFADKLINDGKDQKYTLFEEAKRAKRLRHRSIAEYIDAEIIETHDSVFGKKTEVFLVIEWIEGVSLTEFFQREKPSLTIQLALLNQILRGLRYLHEHGFIHRDLTPNNIMVTKERNQWQVKIIDLGISKNIKAGNIKSTVLVGTPNYMSPEQFDAEEYGTNGTVSYNSDLWSLGIIWYELLAGQLPFASKKQESTIEIIKQVLQAPLQINTQHLPSIYSLFFKNVLVRNSQQRIASANELMQLLKFETKPEKEEKEEPESEEEPEKKKVVTKVFEEDTEENPQSKTQEIKFKPPIKKPEKEPHEKTSKQNWILENKNSVGIGLILLLVTLLIFWRPFNNPNPIESNTIDSSPYAVADSSNQELEVAASADTTAAAGQADPVDEPSDKKIAGNEGRLSQKKEPLEKPKTIGYSTMRDRDGNVYRTVKIGSQEWMAENLNVSAFRNGDPIPQAKTKEEWLAAGEAKQPAWCYYENSTSNGNKYGKLYNWYAVHDSRGLAPKGWSVPTDQEWTQLESAIGSNPGKKLKSQSGWYDNGNGTDSYGFVGLPGGYRNSLGYFSSLSKGANWWSASEDNTEDAWYRSLNYSNDGMGRNSGSKTYGFSVRCLRD